MRYLKTHLKVLAVIFLGLSLMALIGDPIESSMESNNSNSVADSN
jgi:hypothetical protein